MFEVLEYAGLEGQRIRYGRLIDPERAVPAERSLLFLPGLGGTVKASLPFLRAMLSYYDPIYGVDLRGFGLNALPEHLDAPQYHDTQGMLNDLVLFYEEVLRGSAGYGKTPQLGLAGISLGGTLATLLAATAPERYESLLLLAPAYRPHPETFSKWFAFRHVLGKMLFGRSYHVKLPYGIEAMTRQEKYLEDPQYRNNPMPPLSARFLLDVRQMGETALNRADQLKMPTMVLIPGGDRVCDPEAMRVAFQRIPADTPKHCREFPEAYHNLLMEEDQEALAYDYLGWVIGHRALTR